MNWYAPINTCQLQGTVKTEKGSAKLTLLYDHLKPQVTLDIAQALHDTTILCFINQQAFLLKRMHQDDNRGRYALSHPDTVKQFLNALSTASQLSIKIDGNLTELNTEHLKPLHHQLTSKCLGKKIYGSGRHNRSAIGKIDLSSATSPPPVTQGIQVDPREANIDILYDPYKKGSSS